jgi:hemoglobin-like flavoprotein
MPTVAELALRHKTYGVAVVHYPVVGETLLSTLAQGLCDNYTRQVEAAWAAAFTFLSSAMIAASTEARRKA